MYINWLLLAKRQFAQIKNSPHPVYMERAMWFSLLMWAMKKEGE